MLNGTGTGRAGVPFDARCNEFTSPFSKRRWNAVSALPFLTALTSSTFVAVKVTLAIFRDQAVHVLLSYSNSKMCSYPQMV